MYLLADSPAKQHSMASQTFVGIEESIDFWKNFMWKTPM